MRLWLLVAALHASADVYRVDEARWTDALHQAAASRPIVVFFRPVDCAEKGFADPCAEFAERIAHPSMQRRLADVVFLVETIEAGDPAVAVYDSAGALASRWFGVPDAMTFTKMLNLIEGAAVHLANPSARTSALAALALGNRDRGRAGLEALLQSPNEEDRQLAAIWLLRLAPAVSPAELDRLQRLAERGATELVRFEAWMAAGDFQVAHEQSEDAIRAYRRAVDEAPGAQNRSAALATLHRLLESNSPILGLGSPGEIVSGRRTLQPRKLPSNTARVEIRLDERLVATSKVTPFVSSVDFGRVPRRQILDVAAIDKTGKLLRRTSVVVNERSNAFSVHIVEPAAATLSGNVEVEVSARAPRSVVMESVVVEWNGKTMARFVAPPYRTRVNIKSGEMGILRAVLRLADGSETEDVRLLNSHDPVMASEVNLVEVPAYLESPAVTAEQLLLREGGKPRAIDRLVPAADAPLRIALVLDSSASMTKHMPDLQEAAVQFVEKEVGPQDETMVVGFGSALQILPPTRKRALAERAILRLFAEGPTPLHDAMITAMLRLQVSGSRRALVVFSDGVDTCSVFESRDVAEVARRIGVPIYVLSFEPDVSPGSTRRYDRLARMTQGGLAKLSRSSGGKVFRLRSLEQLPAIWSEIGTDLRKQALVIYRTDPMGAEWRTLSLSIRGGREVRAPVGVYVSSSEER